MANIWDSIKAIPSFVASIIAIVATIISVAAWASGHFATQRYVEFAKCFSDAADDSIAAQLETSAYYTEYKIAKNHVIELEAKLETNPGDPELKSALEEATKLRESHWNNKEKKIIESAEALKRKQACQA